MKAKINNGKFINCSISQNKKISGAIKNGSAFCADFTNNENISAGSTQRGPQGIQGATGAGVDRVEPISQQGYDITYRMYFTDGRYYDYVVSNGTGSLKWLHIDENDWTLIGDRYRYTYAGSYGVIELFEGTIASKSKIEFNSTIEGGVTYLYAIQPFEGYALVASLENEQSVLNVYGEGNIEVTREGRNITVKTVNFVFEQSIASDRWVIVHNLNKKPGVILTDSAGTEFKAYIEYDSLDQCTVYINGATTGKAYLN